MQDNRKKVFANYKEQIKSAFNDLQTPGMRHRQIPNILTFARMFAPIFIIPSAIVGNLPLTISLTAAFSLTDLIDGFIARKFNLTSELGRDLDAACDKIFAGTLLIASSFINPILLTNLALEGIIAGINTYKKVNNMEVKSSLVGKIKTWPLFGLIGLGMISPYIALNGLFKTLFITTTAMQLLTANSYLKNNNKVNNSKTHINNTNSNNQKIVVEEKDNFSKDKELKKYLKNTKEINIRKSQIEELNDVKKKILDLKNESRCPQQENKEKIKIKYNNKSTSR